MLSQSLYYLLLVIIGVVISLPKTLSFSGEATTYGSSGYSSGGACGFRGDWLTKHNMYTAFSGQKWDQSLHCGRCAKVQYGNNKPVTVLIVDKCPECKPGDLDLSKDAWNAVTKKGPGREVITWTFVDCPNPSFKYRIKEGSNKHWVAFQPQEFKVGVMNVDIFYQGKWQALKRDESTLTGLFFLFKDQRGLSTFKLRSTFIDGSIIESKEFHYSESMNLLPGGEWKSTIQTIAEKETDASRESTDTPATTTPNLRGASSHSSSKTEGEITEQPDETDQQKSKITPPPKLTSTPTTTTQHLRCKPSKHKRRV